ATGMARSFPSVQHVVMCGIAGRIPVGVDSAEQVRLGDIVSAAEGLVDYGHLRVVPPGAELRRAVDGLSRVLQRADRELAARELPGGRPWLDLIDERADDLPVGFRRPDAGQPRVHRTIVASADWLLRDARVRDDLAVRFNARAVEMEGSGIAVAADLQGLHW